MIFALKNKILNSHIHIYKGQFFPLIRRWFWVKNSWVDIESLLRFAKFVIESFEGIYRDGVKFG